MLPSLSSIGMTIETACGDVWSQIVISVSCRHTRRALINPGMVLPASSRLYPRSGHQSGGSACPLWAISGLFFPASNEDAANRNNKSNQAEYSKLTNRPAWRSAGQKLTAATAGPLATVCIAAETRGRPAPSPIQTRRHPQRKTCSRHTPWKPHWATQFLSMELR